MPEAGHPARLERSALSTVRRSTTGTVGLLLAGRYRLDVRLGADGDSSSWEGHDVQLDRGVLVRVIAGRHVDDALDAARRAAGLDEPRLARILDVGTARATDGALIGWVVEERPGGQRLADLVRERPLAASRARAVVGEAATALDRAGRSGLHHRRLDASCVYLEGTDVVVTGLVVAAAAAGRDDAPAGEADREDAVALVAVLYAALSGFWPLGRSGGLDAAPRSAGAPVPVRDLAAGVPNDLDTLLAVTLGPFDDGPFSPAELVQQLAPWDHGASVAPVALPETAAAPAGREPVAAGASTTPAPAQPPAAPAPAGRGAVRQGARQTGSFARPARPSTAQPIRPLSRTGIQPRAALAGAAAAGAAAAPPPAPPEARSERRAGARSVPRPEPRPVPRPALRPAGARHPTGDLDPLIAALATPDPSRPGAPRPLRRAAGLWVAGLLAVALVVAAAVAWQQLPRLRGVLGIAPAPSGSPVLPLDGAATPQPSGPPAPAPTAVEIAEVRALDPFGDVTENDELLPLAVDGDPATAWASSTYRSAALGGLKRGVGVDLALAAEVPVTEVELLVGGGGGTVEVRTSPDGGFDASEVVGAAEVGDGAGGPVVVALPEGTRTSHVVLWFTTLPATPDGFAVELYSATVR